MCVCVCVCVTVVQWVRHWAHNHKVVSNMPQLIWCSHPLSPPPCGVRNPSNTIPPVHPAASGIFWGVNYLAIFHIPALVQVGLRVPTPLSGRDGQSFCELLALLQEFASIGSECLLNAQAAWLCQVSVTA